jgi:hypothetical protein
MTIEIKDGHMVWNGYYVFITNEMSAERMKWMDRLCQRAAEAWGRPNYAEARAWLQECSFAKMMGNPEPPIPDRRTNYEALSKAVERKQKKISNLRWKRPKLRR